ncbi:MAG: queuosine precursor transporter [Candidatus Babeliales bacterium]|nr:queuosine precursor transporter [Candidatus Babeliales bacterium]
MNEIIFLFHSIVIGLFAIAALKLGKTVLVSLLCLQVILSNLFVSKQIIIWGLNATSSDVFSIGAGLCLNLIQEYYGKVIAKRAIWISFFCLSFYLLMTQIHLVYSPSEFDTTQNIYTTLFGLMPRLVVSSLVSYLISQNLDAYLYGYFRDKFSGKYFFIRNYGALLISQMVDTACFTILGLYGVLHNPFEIFIVSYCIKVVSILVCGAVVGFCKKWIKINE